MSSLGAGQGGVLPPARPDSSSAKDKDKFSPCTAARKFFKRLKYDSSLDASEFTVGLLETREQAERKSGAEAWSLRLHSMLVELSFADCVAKYEAEGEEVPFHRIVWFKQNGVIVWEADNLRSKTAAGDSAHQHSFNNNNHHSSHWIGGTPLSSSFTGCSPPAGSFMARIASAAADGSFSGSAGLPPRAASITLDSNNAAAGSGAAAGGSSSSCRVQRLSGTDLLGTSPGSSSWGGPGHWSSAAAAAAAGGSQHFVGSYHSSTGQSPLLGSSPIGASSTLFGTSPKLAGSFTGSGSFTGAGGCSSALMGTSPRGASYHHASPYGSCSSSWTGTSPLAAAAAAGTSPVLLRQGTPAAGVQPGWPVGRVELAAEVADGQQGGAEQQQTEGADAVLVDYSAMPEECWVNVLQRLGVRELCYMSRVSRSLRSLASRSFLWSCAYERLFGMQAPPDWSFPTLKRMCRRSELKASRWLEAEVEARAAGVSGTCCCQLDDTKVLSGDGCAVRLWALETGRRIATLRGHTGRVTAVAFDEDYVISGCSQGTVKLWSMDELKLAKTLRHHTEPVTAAVLYNGMPISGGKDGCVCLWDAAVPNNPLVVLEVNSPVHSLRVHEERGQLITGGSTLGVWDLATAQLLCNLAPPAGLTGSHSTASLTGAAGRNNDSSSAGAVGAAAAAAAAGNEGLDADAEDGVLLHDGWLLDEEEEEEEAAAAALAGAGGGHGQQDSGRPFTSISSDTHLLAAGRAGAVVLWDLRSQDPVGMIRAAAPAPVAAGACGWPAAAAAPAAKAPDAPCVGVQLDGWKLVTGFVAAAAGGDCSGGGGAGAAGSAACWRCSSSGGGGGNGNGAAEYGGGGGGAAAVRSQLGGHSLEVYDIRAAASFSSCNAAAAAASSSSRASRSGLWSAAPVMTLPVANRVTCFQFHGQNLLVGQEGADCCLMMLNPPGTSSSRAAAAWGYGAAGCGSSSGASYGMMAAAAAGGGGVYGASPGAVGGSWGAAAEDGSSGSKQKKKGGAKVPAKKQTRYPKRATR